MKSFVAAGQTDRTIGATTIRDHVKKTDWGKISYKVNDSPMLSAKNIEKR